MWVQSVIVGQTVVENDDPEHYFYNKMPVINARVTTRAGGGEKMTK